MIHLEKIVQQINTKNNNEVFDLNHLDGLQSFLNQSFADLEYINHGGHIICLRSSKCSGQVIKCCKTNSAIKSYQHLQDKAKQLIMIGCSILQPEECIFENEFWFAYLQPECKVLSKDLVNPFVVKSVLMTLKQMILHNKISPDLRIENHGIHQNKIVLFDYNDEFVETNNGLLIQNLWQLFTCLANNDPAKFNCFTNIEFDSAQPSSKFLQDLQTTQVKFAISLFDNLINNKQDEIIESLCLMINWLEKRAAVLLNDYQKILIDHNGKINLFTHTRSKMQIVQETLKLITDRTHPISFLDAGCALGSIGNCIAQDNPNLQVTLNNITKVELDTAKFIAKETLLQNVSFSDCSITDYKASFTCTAYFAVFHHILKNLTIDQVCQVIKSQTNEYAIIELPVQGDILLDKIVGANAENTNRSISDVWNTTYKCLQSVNELMSCLQKHFSVISVDKIDYNLHNETFSGNSVSLDDRPDDLNRFVFVCKMKNE